MLRVVLEMENAPIFLATALLWYALCDLTELQELFVGFLALKGLEALGLLYVLRLDAHMVSARTNLRDDACTLHTLGEAANEIRCAFASGLFYFNVS